MDAGDPGAEPRPRSLLQRTQFAPDGRTRCPGIERHQAPVGTGSTVASGAFAPPGDLRHAVPELARGDGDGRLQSGLLHAEVLGVGRDLVARVADPLGGPLEGARAGVRAEFLDRTLVLADHRLQARGNADPDRLVAALRAPGDREPPERAVDALDERLDPIDERDVALR